MASILNKILAFTKDLANSYCGTAVTNTIQLFVTIPASMGVAGSWVKDLKNSTPMPGPCDKIIKANFIVQNVRNRLKDIQV